MYACITQAHIVLKLYSLVFVYQVSSPNIHNFVFMAKCSTLKPRDNLWFSMKVFLYKEDALLFQLR